MLSASGVWGAVHEPADSGPFNAHDLDGSPAILADMSALFRAVALSPPDLALPGGEDGFGPRAFNVSLAQARALPDFDDVAVTFQPERSKSCTQVFQ